LEKAVDALKGGLHKAKEMGSGLCLRIIFMHLGSCFRSMKDYRQTEEYFEASLTLARSLNNRNEEIEILHRLGKCTLNYEISTKPSIFLMKVLIWLKPLAIQNLKVSSLRE
jgi:uncharacterized protein HemY